MLGNGTTQEIKNNILSPLTELRVYSGDINQMKAHNIYVTHTRTRFYIHILRYTYVASAP